ncbi:MAG TPA: HupE/UreJ family protein [Verrucomicrobiae bacterium]|jgi:urease accessory protein
MKNLFKISSKLHRALPLGFLLLLPSLAQAHPGMLGHIHGFANGLTHPLTGLDHICAMIAVGLWAAQRGGRACWFIPLVFVSVMSIGGMLGLAGIQIPFAEVGIIASVLILGVLVAAAVRLPLAVSSLIVGTFALFHGFAHGAEMPETASGLNYAWGFMFATACLHLCGVGLGLLAKEFAPEKTLRWTGGAIAACGLYLCLV